ncbi:MAG: cytidine deaminase family protein, partial [Bryobacteraceae bacterium]
AERVAIFKAISEGIRPQEKGDEPRVFDAIAIYTEAPTLTPPCGACRQIIWEFCRNIPVIMANKGAHVKIYEMLNLLVEPFDLSNLK